MAINTIRMTGLTSGLDTESIISAMTATAKYKVDYEKQSKQLLELKKEAWKDMNAKIYSFYTSTLNDFKFKTTYGKTSISNSNSNVISIAQNANLPAGTHTINVEEVAKAAMVSSKSIDGTAATTLAELGVVDGEVFEVTVGGKTASVTINNAATTPVKELETAMKLAMKDEGMTDVNFSFDISANAFIINTKNTGASQSITLGGSGDWGKLGIEEGLNGFEYKGQNAEYTYNGGVTLVSESNAININGLRATIIGESNGTPVTIAVVKDVEGTLAVARKFVEEYNKLIEEMNTLIDAPSARNYRPLTDEQKESMSEGDIKLWEDRVKGSILRKDTVLSSIAADMRSIIGNSDLFKLGISTGKDWTEKGKLYIDEEKLTTIIEEDPETFDAIFKEVGTKLYDNISQKLRGTTDKSSNFLFADKVLNKQIRDSEDRIGVLEDRLVKQEDLYYAKFTAMEKMLSQLNSQSSWLTGQFS